MKLCFHVQSSSGYFFPMLVFHLFFFIFAAKISVVAANPSSPESNLTLTVESVPVKNTSNGPKSLLQRLNIQVNSVWSKFKCQFYTRATVPVSKLLNVKVPKSMELSNITNCHQLNVVVGQLANSTGGGAIAEQMSSLESEASTMSTNSGENRTTISKSSPGPTSSELLGTESTTMPSLTTSLSPVTSAALETTTIVPSTESAPTSTVDAGSSVGSGGDQSTTTPAIISSSSSPPEELSTPPEKPVVGAKN